MEGDPNPHLQLDDRDLQQGVVADLEELELQLHLRHLHLDPHLHGVVAELEVPLLLTVAEFDAPLLLTVLGLAPDLFCFCFYFFCCFGKWTSPSLFGKWIRGQKVDSTVGCRCC